MASLRSHFGLPSIDLNDSGAADDKENGSAFLGTDLPPKAALTTTSAGVSVSAGSLLSPLASPYVDAAKARNRSAAAAAAAQSKSDDRLMSPPNTAYDPDPNALLHRCVYV